METRRRHVAKWCPLMEKRRGMYVWGRKEKRKLKAMSQF